MVRTKIVHTSGMFWVIFVRKHLKKNILTMFPYRVKYIESESDIQNIDLLYKIHQKCQNTFDLGGVDKLHKKTHFIICINRIIHILYFL